MAVFRIERTRDYTVMSNHHLRNANLSLKAKGLLSMMLSLPEDWNYTTRGLATGETNCPTFRGKKTFGRNTAVQFNGSGNTELFSTCHLHQH